jgi:hypothetical protein
MRFFNTAGPVDCGRHYCLPPLGRFDLDEILLLIQQQKYFVLHAPRQTGKTSSLLALMDYLNPARKFDPTGLETADFRRQGGCRGARNYRGCVTWVIDGKAIPYAPMDRGVSVPAHPASRKTTPLTTNGANTFSKVVPGSQLRQILSVSLKRRRSL